MKYHSCISVEQFYLFFRGRIDMGGKFIRPCCEPIADFPGVALQETAEESLKSITSLRAGIISESIEFGPSGRQESDKGRSFTSTCAKCVKYKLDDWNGGDGLIHHVNLAMDPSPCQCKCVYCSSLKSDDRKIHDKQRCDECYEKVFGIIELARNNGMIAADAMWHVASNEITIHPFKDRIYELVKGQSVSFFTNCFIYDESIAANLAANTLSSICLSIDSGTPETWLKVKGVDNFASVTANLAKYSASIMRPGQIQLKYIILPGINDDLEDFRALVDIMKSLKVRRMTIACDCFADDNKYSCCNGQRDAFVRAAAYLTAVLQKNEMIVYISQSAFLPGECEKVFQLAGEILKSGEV